MWARPGRELELGTQDFMENPQCSAWILVQVGKKLLGAPGIATRSKDATRGFWTYY